MTQNHAFLQAIFETPDDDTPRLIYADWLQERGQAEWAELIRAQCEQAARVAIRSKDEALARHARMRHLKERVSVLLAQPWAQHWLRLGAAFERGLPARFVLDASRFLVEGEQLGDWLEHGCWLSLRQADRHVEALADCSLLERVAALDLSGNRVGDDGLAVLMESPHLGRVRRLNLSSNRILPAGIDSLVGARSLGELVSLDLSYNRVGILGARSLGGGPGLSTVRSLNLSVCFIRDAGVQALAASPHLAHLTALQLDQGEEIGLGNSPWQPGVGDEGARALAQATFAETLCSLSLRYNDIGDEGARALAASARLRSLSRLDLHRNHIGSEAAQVLAERFGVGVELDRQGSELVDGVAATYGWDAEEIAAPSRDEVISLLRRAPVTLSPPPRQEVVDMLRICKERYEEDEPRLRLANWLAEHGDRRGEHIRVQIGLGGLSRADPAFEDLTRQEQELLDVHEADWVGPLRPLVQRWRFDRGLMRLTVTPRQLLSRAFLHATDSEAFAWVDEVWVDEATEEELAALVRAPVLNRITCLDLSGLPLEDAGAQTLAHGAVSGVGTTRLSLGSNELTVVGLRAVFESPLLARTEKLDLMFNRGLGDEAARALAAAPLPARLRELYLCHTGIEAAGALALAASPYLEQLTLLALGGNAIGPEAEEALRQRFGQRLRL
jgi:uncharacterized protein (TIGR02996 family)